MPQNLQNAAVLESHLRLELAQQITVFRLGGDLAHLLERHVATVVDADRDDVIMRSPVVHVCTCARAQLLLHRQLLEGDENVRGVAASERGRRVRHLVERTTRLEVVLQNIHHGKKPILLCLVTESNNVRSARHQDC